MGIGGKKEQGEQSKVCGFRDQQTADRHTLMAQSLCLHLCVSDDLWQSVFSIEA